MFRWFLALTVVLLTGLALWGTSRVPSSRGRDTGVVDEILAYEVTDRTTVTLDLPSGLEQVFVTVWSATEPAPPHDPNRAYAFSLEASLKSEQTPSTVKRRYDVSSRISGDPSSVDAQTRFSARLAYSADWVTDARTIQVDTRPVAAYGGKLSLRALGPAVRLLLRVSYAEPRSEIERDLLERRLTLEERRQLVGGRYSLGFADLPTAARVRALAAWQRRLVALGKSGRDYVQRRLLLGSLRASAPAKPEDLELFLELGPDRAAALNATGPLGLRVQTSPGAVIAIDDGGTLRTVFASESGQIAFSSPAVEPRTIALRSQTNVRALVTVARTDLERLLGAPRLRATDEDRFQVAPDYRLQRYCQLHPERPVVVRVAPGQEIVGLSVRARLGAGQVYAAPGISARWKPTPGSAPPAVLKPTLEPSTFDRFDDAHGATNASVAMLRVPQGASELELFGDPVLAIALWTKEPRVTENVLESEYRVPLAEDQSWRHAPYEVRTWTAILPDNYDVLLNDQRVLELTTQARIERNAGASSSPPERALQPLGAPVTRELLIPAQLEAGVPFPDNGWTRVAPRRRVRIAAEGARAGLLQLVYRADPSSLGDELELLVDGIVERREPLVLTSGRLRAELAPGLHELLLEGLGPNGVAFAKAAPADSSAFHRSFPVHELSKASPLDFAVDQKPGEHVTLMLFVTTESGERDFKLWFSIDGGTPARQAGTFYQRTSDVSGTLTGKGGSDGFGTMWQVERADDLGAAERDGMARARIVLGDDLRPGRHVVRLRYAEPPASIVARDGAAALRVWVRAVLIGQAPGAPGESTRLSTTENLP
jgi:hypothetical protein